MRGHLWRRCQNGGQAHLVVSGESFCGVEAAGEEVENPPHEDRCHNCDQEWRRRGRKKRVQRPKPARRTTYTPRFRFEDFDK